MELKRIPIEEFKYFYSLLEKDFPYNERKSSVDELESFSNPLFSPNFIYDNDRLVGYFCYWQFEEFIYGEHLAILKDIRNHGIGTRFINQFLSQLSKPLIVEVERPTTKIASRRIKFYERLGFVVNDLDYIQPSYHKRGKGVPMLIISYNEKIDNKKIKEYIETIKENVYTLSK